jgi:hypothetical protein
MRQLLRDSSWRDLRDDIHELSRQAQAHDVLFTLGEWPRREGTHWLTRTFARFLTLGVPRIPRIGGWLVGVIGPPLITVLLLAGLDLVHDKGFVAVVGFGVAGWACVLVAGLYLLAFPRSLRDIDSIRGWQTAEVVFWGLTVVGTVTFAFAICSLLLAGQVSAAGKERTPWLAFGHYLWHFTDAISALAIPSSLGWETPKLFVGTTAGVALIFYKLLLIVPLFRLAAGFLKARLGEK